MTLKAPNTPCPECGSHMDQGYVLSNYPIRWTKSETKGKYWVAGLESLSGGLFRLAGHKCPGLLCRNCDLAIFRTRPAK